MTSSATAFDAQAISIVDNWTVVDIERVRKALLVPPKGFVGERVVALAKVTSPLPHLLRIEWSPGDGTTYRVDAFKSITDEWNERSVSILLWSGNLLAITLVVDRGLLTNEYVEEKAARLARGEEYELKILTFISGVITGRETDVDFSEFHD